MMFRVILFFMVFAATHASAKEPKAASSVRPKVFEDVVTCKSIPDAGKRLLCYDKQVGLLDAAEQSRDIILTDKAAIKEVRKNLFGFNIPKIKLFGDEGASEASEMEAVIKTASINRSGRWTIILEDGAQWQQTESEAVNRDPKTGMSAKIRKAALGSYFVNIAGQRAVRMRRVN